MAWVWGRPQLRAQETGRMENGRPKAPVQGHAMRLSTALYERFSTFVPHLGQVTRIRPLPRGTDRS